MTGELRWSALFDRLGLWLALFAFLMREAIPNATCGHGLNLFIHLLFWIALTLWFAARGVNRGGFYRFSGIEFALIAFAAFALLSVLRARFKLAAIDSAFAWLSLSLFFVICIQALGTRTLLQVLLSTLICLSAYALVQYFVLFPMLEPEAAKTTSVEMARRIRTNEVFATLAGPNQFAGFLALLIPVALGSLLDTREYRWRGAMLALGTLSIALTGSLGGWVALACGMVTLLGLALTRSRGRSPAIAVGMGAVGVAVALLLFSPLLSVMARKSHSMHVRAVYWRATGPMIRSAPLLGVGLDNWQEHYFRTKSDVQQETVKTHNDYLQLLAETGVLGFLSFAAILGLGLRKALVRPSQPAPDPEPPSPWLVGGVVGVMMLLGLFNAQDPEGRPDWIGRGVVLLLGTVWLGSWLLLQRRPATGDLTWTRFGVAGGLVALLVHMVVDFQIYQYGVAASLMAVLALAALLRGDLPEIRLSRGACLAGMAVVMAISFYLTAFIAPRAIAADGEIEEVKAALFKLERSPDANATALLSEAIRVDESAQAHNPLDPEAFQLYARLKYREWQINEKVGAGPQLDVIEGTLLQALDNAISLRPLSSPLYDEKAQVHLAFRRHYLKEAKTSELARAKASEHLRLAAECQRRAYELYPTISRNAYLLARVLELLHDPEANTYYREALRLAELAGRELENLDRMKLSPLGRARALRAVGKAFEAHDSLVSDLRRAVAGLSPAEARAGLERYVKLSADELEEGMAPVLKDAIEDIMRDLKARENHD